MTYDGLKVLDADAHVVEPPDVFGRWTELALDFIDLPPTTPMIPCGDADVIADQLSNGFDAPSYLRAMDAQGIDAVVLYPSVGLFVPFAPQLDAAGSADACRSYNEWAAGYCAADEARMAAVGLVPLVDVDRAVAEVRHLAQLGLVGAMVRPNHLYGRNLGDPYYDPLYEAVAGEGIVLSVHEGLGVRGPTIGSDRFTGFAARHMLSHPMEQMAAMTSLMLDGALERHPDLRVAFLESGTGWLPYWLDRLDDHREWLEDSETKGLSLAPSEYFARQCAISTDPEDHLVAGAIGTVGADHVLWASDFPHPDALFPTAVEESVADARTSGIDDDALSSVLWETPMRFYGLDSRFTVE